MTLKLLLRNNETTGDEYRFIDNNNRYTRGGDYLLAKPQNYIHKKF